MFVRVGLLYYSHVGYCSLPAWHFTSFLYFHHLVMGCHYGERFWCWWQQLKMNPQSLLSTWPQLFMYLNHHCYFHLGGSSNDEPFSILSLPVCLFLVSVCSLHMFVCETFLFGHSFRNILIFAPDKPQCKCTPLPKTKWRISAPLPLVPNLHQAVGALCHISPSL